MTQAQALKIMKSGANVFLTGAPGSGKTYTLYQFIEWAEQQGKRIAVTASTGIAASHIGGITIHSWSGTGIAESITKDDLRRYGYNRRLVKRYKKTDILVIDEVSMLHGRKLDIVNAVAKELRGNGLPFGGMQVILVGDLFQLPPVERERTEIDFAHKSFAWDQLNPQTCYLTEQHRQEADDLLLGILEAMRTSYVKDDQMQLLKNRIGVSGDNLTKLFSHNVDVDAINQAYLDRLPGKPKGYSMTVDGDKYLREGMKRNILAPEKLILKVGAEVMFVANNFSEGFVNGSRGKVVKFKNGLPIVKLKTGQTIKVDYHIWKIKEDDQVLASVEQIPLRLAWAITIHKSQGMSLDAAEVDLTKAFQPAMGYVALSRVRSLAGLYLVGLNDMALTMHEEIFEFDKQLREESEALI